MALVTDAWRPYIREPDGEISRRYYELCCGTCGAHYAQGVSGSNTVGGMLIRIPI